MECDIIVFQLPIIHIFESHKQHTFTGSQVSELSLSFNSAVKIQIARVRVPVLLGSDCSDCINFRIDDISFQNNLRIIFPDFPSGYSIVGSALHCLLKPDRIPIVIPEQITDFYCFIVPGCIEIVHDILRTAFSCKIIFRQRFFVFIVSDIYTDHQKAGAVLGETKRRSIQLVVFADVPQLAQITDPCFKIFLVALGEKCRDILHQQKPGQRFSGVLHLCKYSSYLPQQAGSAARILVYPFVIAMKCTDVGKILTGERIGENIYSVRHFLSFQSTYIDKVMISPDAGIDVSQGFH